MARSKSVPAGNLQRHLAARTVAYLFAVIIGFGLLPTAFSVADRATVLRVSNLLLDLVSRKSPRTFISQMEPAPGPTPAQ